jgi:hypothetical protein
MYIVIYDRVYKEWLRRLNDISCTYANNNNRNECVDNLNSV